LISSSKGTNKEGQESSTKLPEYATSIYSWVFEERNKIKRLKETV